MTAFRDWLNTVFGSDGGRAVQMILALLLVVALLLALAWLFRRIFGAGLSGGKGGRLAVVDAAHVDSRRRLVLLRRDDVEHLVMIGGPNDLLVESRILRAPPVIAAQSGRIAPRTAPRPQDDVPPRAEVADETTARPAAQRPGIGAIGAAIAGAGAFVRARTGRAGPDEAPEAEPTAARQTVDMAFDAPLGRAESAPEAKLRPAQPARVDLAPPPQPPAAEPRPSMTPAEPRPSMIPTDPRPPLAAQEPRPPMPPVQRPPMTPPRAEAPPARVDLPPARVEAPAAEPMLPPQPAPVRAEAPVAPAPVARPQGPEAARPQPAPVLVEPVHIPAIDPQERLGLELERALADLGLSDDPIAPPHTARLQTSPDEAPARSAADIDLLSELDLVVAEQMRTEPPVEPPAPKVEPRFEPTPAPQATAPVPPPAAPKPPKVAKPDGSSQPAPKAPKAAIPAAPIAPPVVPVAPVDTARFEQSFADSLLAPAPEPVIPAPPVVIPAPVADHASAPEVAAPPPPAKTPVDELEEEMARLLSEISGPTMRR